MAEAPQLVIAFEADDAGEAALRSLIASIPDAAGLELALHPLAPGTPYLDGKHQAFARVEREVVVFLDFDVVPEPGWLGALLSPFGNPKVAVVTGSLFIDGASLYARATQLFWFFEPRPTEEGLAPVMRILGTNVAFRSATYARFPFVAGRSFRGDIYGHARRIWDAGIPVLSQRSARGGHPPPDGLWSWLSRALGQGHDFALLQREVGGGGPFASFSTSLRAANDRIERRRRPLRAGWGTVVASKALALAYYSVMLLGHLVSRANPELVERWFPI